MGIDNKTVLTGISTRGRASVRLESKKQYTTGLFIADIQHMPGNICGSWPAFWTVDLQDWPHGGEIDIMENINEQAYNQETLHTLPGCKLTQGYGNANRHLESANCDTSVNYNSGCGVLDDDSVKQPSFGTPFSTKGGGIYAMVRKAVL
ncbi:MAG: hypothetical protein M1818_006992 [Claussenomyces sp. TS43310]|nr:MAG: hypothetical protein M1818_006992 [Claussenomyces sp. TS43310]